MQRQELDGKSRDELVALAEQLGVTRPRVLTQPELIDEILKRTTTGPRDRARARGWLGRARDLLASVVERGLHLPDAARVLRATPDDRAWPTPPPPLPTVTLAEIYAAQGHLDRAIAVLDEVLGREPEHHEARAMRERFEQQLRSSPPRGGRVAPATMAAPSEEPVATPLVVTETVARPVEEPVATPLVVTETVARPVEEPVALATPELAAPIALATPVEATVAIAAPVEEVVAVATPDPAGEASTTAAPEPAPLPQHYDLDEVVGIAVDPRTVYLYWEVRPTSLAHARARQPGGSLALRVVSVAPSWDGPLTETRDVPVDELYGDRFVREVRPGANVRVSVGWLTTEPSGEALFEPFAVGVELTAPRAEPVRPVAAVLARWSPDAPTAPRPQPAWNPRSPATAPDVLEPGASFTVAGEGAGPPMWDLDLPEVAGVRRAVAANPIDEGAPLVPGARRTPRIIEREAVAVRRVGASELVRETYKVRVTLPGVPGGGGQGGAGPVRHGGASELARASDGRRSR